MTYRIGDSVASSTSLAVVSDPWACLYEPAGLRQLEELAMVVERAELLCPSHLRGKPADVMLILAMARAMGVSPIWALQSAYVISGKIGWAAQFLIARANESHRFRGPIRWTKQGEGDSFAVTAFATLAETGDDVEFTVTMAMAHAEGWTKRNPKYRTMPDLMLRYRSATLLVRLFCPEVLMGLYERDELVDSGRDDPSPARVVISSAPPPTPTGGTRDRPALPAPSPTSVAPSTPPTVVQAPSERSESGSATDTGSDRTWSRWDAVDWSRDLAAAGLNFETVADLCERAEPPRPRPSAQRADQRAKLLRWLLGTTGRARYDAIATERTETLAAVRSLSIAERRDAAAAAGTGTESGRLSLMELHRLLAAHEELHPMPIAQPDPGGLEGLALAAAITDLVSVLPAGEVHGAGVAAGLPIGPDGPVTDGAPEPMLRRYRQELDARLPEPGGEG